jgi:hypothetical protein
MSDALATRRVSCACGGLLQGTLGPGDKVCGSEYRGVVGLETTLCAGRRIERDAFAVKTDAEFVAFKARVAEVLARIEWKTNDNGQSACPCCDGLEEYMPPDGGHRAGCALAALLREARG